LKKTISFLIIFSVFCLLIPACEESDGSNFIFKYDIPVNPRTLDPQTATGQTSALLISNMFDGLLKVNSEGNIISNVAAEYFISDDGLTYTFLLRDDVYWYFDGDDNTPCTAHDFVFAFRRLFNPAVKSENAALFYSIKYAEDVHKGANPDLNTIGVEAESDHKLIISLEYPNPMLPYLLTTAPAMPCNEELFEKTAGRYGLNENSIPSNGSFYITRWNFDPYSPGDGNNIIIMRRNNKNSLADRVYPHGLNFFIGWQDTLGHFTEGSVQALIAEGSDAEALEADGFLYDGYESSVWGITFNTRGVFRNADLRFALATGFDKNQINLNKKGWRDAYDAIPPLVNLANEPYRIAAGEATALKPDIQKAVEAFERGAREAGYENITGLNIIMPDNQTTAFEYLSRIMQQWQSSLGFFCSIKTLPDVQFREALSSGDFDIAFVKLTGEYNNPDAYLSRFGSQIRGVPSPTSEYRSLLTQARRAIDPAESAELYLQAENMLLQQAVFVPVGYQTEMLFYHRRASDLIYNPFAGTISFKEAKWR
jgi:oligopeptide transport system substrate-binding protein